MRKAQISNDPELFKKLSRDIWEFRTLFNKTHYRLFAFWDNSAINATVVIATHGMTKKSAKTPLSDLAKAESLRQAYKNQNDSR